ncbi:DUF4374 domain-containing protein [Sphingobacterium pedocola]|uniref:DUF4374 domain-containing protein n=1 Tax=Sphingobacterium pedocola TaxID=2082722 RepID=A0ABR9T3B5_9SPHI|nr:DUF4374 domain-containing protein [Sphingobacterium pedocola]MBE8719826.1 hypothetical protein [Sphingobacterium pedocola]
MKKLLIALLAVSVFTSCKKDDVGPPNYGDYIVAVSPIASTGVADYLLTAATLDEGSVTTRGHGVEQDGTYRYYMTANNKFFSMLYGQGNPGAVTTYEITNGSLNKVSDFQSETVQAFASVNDDILLMKISRNITNKLSNFYIVNTNSLLITSEGTINSAEPSNNGELAFSTWIRQVGDKVFAPYMSVKGCCGDAFGTAFPDSTWIAVYSYPQMKLEKVIKDNRTSFIGRYFVDGTAVDENGDFYAFSSAIAGDAQGIKTTKPSAIVRVNAGTTEFDQSYFLDFEEISGGYNITDWLYVGSGNFVVFMTTREEKGLYAVGKVLGVVNVYNKEFRMVSGLPNKADINSVTTTNYSKLNGVGYVGFTLKEGTSYIYKIDAATASATQGLRVEGGTITAIAKLN